jgi:secretion/DNA translocation related CpaE-like protein
MVSAARARRVVRGPTQPPLGRTPATTPATPPAGVVLCSGTVATLWTVGLRSTAAGRALLPRPGPGDRQSMHAFDARFGPPPVRSLPDRAPVARALLLGADAALRDELARLVASVGAEVDARVDAGASRSAWASADVVLVMADATDSVGALQLPRRANVVVVTARDDPTIFERALAIGAECAVTLPDQAVWLADHVADAVEREAAGAVIAVIGGRGGAGTSTFATSIALAATERGCRALLVDGDPRGGGIDLLLGAESVTGVRWPGLVGTTGRINGRALREALPHIRDVAVLAFDRDAACDIDVGTMQAVVSAARRCSDVVVADLDRRVDASARLVMSEAVVTLLVVPAEVRACAAAAQLARDIRPHAAQCAVAVRVPGPSGLSARAVADAVGLPVCTEVPTVRGLGRLLDLGVAPSTRHMSGLVAAAHAVLNLIGVEPRSRAA